MKNEFPWIEGEPKKAMWCLVTYLSNDEPPSPAVDWVWFNPHALPKFWIGTAGNKMLPFRQPVTHYFPKPEPARTQEKENG